MCKVTFFFLFFLADLEGSRAAAVLGSPAPLAGVPLLMPAPSPASPMFKVTHALTPVQLLQHLNLTHYSTRRTL